MTVPPGNVAADHVVLFEMVTVVRPVGGEIPEGSNVALDAVKPAGVGRDVGQLDVVGFGPPRRSGICDGRLRPIAIVGYLIGVGGIVLALLGMVRGRQAALAGRRFRGTRPFVRAWPLPDFPAT